MVTSGEARDKLPNRFEHWWTALQVAWLLRGEVSSIHLEPLNAAGEGIEFEVRFPDGSSRCDQVKASSKAWTPAALSEVLGKAKGHLVEDKKFFLIVATDSPSLRGLCARARDADVFKDFEESRTGPHTKLFKQVVAAWSGIDEETAWRYLRLVEMMHEPEEGLRRAVELSYALLVRDDPEAVVAVLRALFDQQIHHVLTAPQVWDFLEERGVVRRPLVGDTTTVDALGRAPSGATPLLYGCRWPVKGAGPLVCPMVSSHGQAIRRSRCHEMLPASSPSG